MLQSQLRNNIICFGICLLPFIAWAQGQTDEQLAAHYYREGDFEKAIIYYERLYANRQSDENYAYYLECLIALEKFKDAERLAQRQAKISPTTAKYTVDLGRIYNQSGDDSKAQRHYDRVIKDLNNASVNQILDYGRAFSDVDENDRALEVYYLGRKQIGNAYPFHFQIAQILGQQGNVEGMIEEYLNVLTISRGYLQSVQNTLNRVIGFEESNKYNAALEEQLMQRVQKNPESEVYAEMLIWMLMQQNRYDAAMIQVKALDKRNKENGERVMSLASMALNNFKYDISIDGYTYVKAKGNNSPNYTEAVVGLLKARQLKVTSGAYSHDDITMLSEDYAGALKEFGYRSSTAPIIQQFAHVKAFYESRYNQNAIEEAQEILKKGLNISGLDTRNMALLKMELADVYVLAGKIWDASLLYGQVEKTFKYDEIGFEAKLKNAKVFYYSGEFGWSQAQLDALKGSTSKLIANDALELSAFISENTGLDTTTEALAVFAKSALMLAQHKFDSALFLLDLIEANFPSHSLSDNIGYTRASIAYERGEFEKAADTYFRVYEQFPKDILADNALMEAGRIYENMLQNSEKAMEIYELILTEYSGSLFVVEARKRFRTLRGDMIP